MIEKLQKNSGEMFQISNDDEAKVLLMELGLIDRFSKIVKGVSSTNQFVTGICQTHYILGFLFTGKTVETDNGYLVYAVPRSKFSSQKMKEMTVQIMAALGVMSNGIISFTELPPDSAQN